MDNKRDYLDLLFLMPCILFFHSCIDEHYEHYITKRTMYCYYLRQEVLRSVVFVGWLVGSFVGVFVR